MNSPVKDWTEAEAAILLTNSLLTPIKENRGEFQLDKFVLCDEHFDHAFASYAADALLNNVSSTMIKGYPNEQQKIGLYSRYFIPIVNYSYKKYCIQGANEPSLRPPEGLLMALDAARRLRRDALLTPSLDENNRCPNC